eukprot:2558894-Prymnesium_polylepis.2
METRSSVVAGSAVARTISGAGRAAAEPLGRVMVATGRRAVDGLQEHLATRRLAEGVRTGGLRE